MTVSFFSSADRLAVRYAPLARSLAKKAARRWLLANPADLEDAAVRALETAARAFDPDRGIGFGTYARHRIRWAIHDVVSRPGRRIVRLDAGHSFHRRLIVVPPKVTRIEAIDEVERLIRPLPRIQRDLLRLVYVDGYSQDEAAETMQLSPSYVSRLHSGALRELQPAVRAMIEGGSIRGR